MDFCYVSIVVEFKLHNLGSLFYQYFLHVFFSRLNMSRGLVRNTSCSTKRETHLRRPWSSAPSEAWSWLCPRTTRRTEFWDRCFKFFQPGSMSTRKTRGWILKLMGTIDLWSLINGTKGSQTDPSKMVIAPCWQNWNPEGKWMLPEGFCHLSDVRM